MYKPLVRISDRPYHIYARSNNKEWFHIPLEDVWTIFCGLLGYLTVIHNLKIHGFVLMSNHFHLLATTPNANLDEVMQILMREASRKINDIAGRINHVFGGPYKWCIIRNDNHYMQAYRYIYQNPIRAGLCQKVEEYRFSTIHYLANKKALPFPIYPLQNAGLNEWLNHTLDNEENDCMRRALRRREFKFSLKNSKRTLPTKLLSEK